MTEGDRTQHYFFAEQIGLRFNHKHSIFCTGHNEVQPGILQLTGSGIKNIFVIDISYPCCTDRSVKRHTGKRDRRRGANQGRNVSVNFRVRRHQGRNNLDLVHESFRKQRPDRAVNEAAGQGFFFGRASFTFEETARYATCCIEFFLVVDSQRKKRASRIGFPSSYCCDHDDRVSHGNLDSPTGLPGDLPGLDRDLPVTVLK